MQCTFTCSGQSVRFYTPDTGRLEVESTGLPGNDASRGTEVSDSNSWRLTVFGDVENNVKSGVVLPIDHVLFPYDGFHSLEGEGNAGPLGAPLVRLLSSKRLVISCCKMPRLLSFTIRVGMVKVTIELWL